MESIVERYEKLISHYEALIKTLVPNPVSVVNTVNTVSVVSVVKEEEDIEKYKRLVEKYNRILFEEDKGSVLPDIEEEKTEKEIVLMNTTKKFYIKRKKQEIDKK